MLKAYELIRDIKAAIKVFSDVSLSIDESNSGLLITARAEIKDEILEFKRNFTDADMIACPDNIQLRMFARDFNEGVRICQERILHEANEKLKGNVAEDEKKEDNYKVLKIDLKMISSNLLFVTVTDGVHEVTLAKSRIMYDSSSENGETVSFFMEEWYAADKKLIEGD